MESFAARRHAAALAIVAVAVSVGILAWTLVTVANVNSVGLRSAEETSPVAPQRSSRMAKSDLATTDFARPDFAAMDAFAPGMSAAVQPHGVDAALSEADDGPDWLRVGSLLASAPAGEPIRMWPGDPAALAAVQVPAPAAAVEPADRAIPAEARFTDTAAPAAAGAQPLRDLRPLHEAKSTPTHVAAPVHAAAPRPHRVAAGPRTYLEKVPEQGDAGDVTFRYRRRACTPGNMVDVCYMPESNRARIVVERW